MADVLIKWQSLNRLQTNLATLLEELGSAQDHSDALEGAIGQPYGRGQLSALVVDFESRWSGKRRQLIRDTEKIKEHVDAVIEEFSAFDAEAATNFENSQQ